MELKTALEHAGHTQQSVLVTQRRNGRPQLSNVVHGVRDGVIRVSITADRAKYYNLRREPWAALHFNVGSFWSYVVVEGPVELSPIAERADDATVEELVELYRALQGEHPDWDDYRRAMVADRRVVMRLRPDHAYGMLRS